MRLPKSTLEGRTSYSVPKQELRLTKCFSILNIKRTVHESVCDHSLRKLQGELAQHFHDNGAHVPISIENKTSGNWVALAMPDTVPSRLGLMTRIACLTTLYDDSDNVLPLKKVTGNILYQHFSRDLEDALPLVHDDQETFERPGHALPDQTARNTLANELIKPISESLTSTDRSQGIEVLTAWRMHHRKVTTAPATSEMITSLDGYLCICTSAFSMKPWMTTLRYALGLHLEKHELDAIQPAIEAAMQSVALTRDYWAWPHDSRSVNNNKRLTNAVAVSMMECQCSEVQAMAIVKSAAIAAEKMFLKRKTELLEAFRPEHSEVRMFLDAVEHFAAGNSLWCSSCPLYHGRR